MSCASKERVVVLEQILPLLYVPRSTCFMGPSSLVGRRGLEESSLVREGRAGRALEGTRPASWLG